MAKPTATSMSFNMSNSLCRCAMTILETLGAAGPGNSLHHECRVLIATTCARATRPGQSNFQNFLVCGAKPELPSSRRWHWQHGQAQRFRIRSGCVAQLSTILTKWATCMSTGKLSLSLFWGGGGWLRVNGPRCLPLLRFMSQRLEHKPAFRWTPHTWTHTTQRLDGADQSGVNHEKPQVQC